MGIWFPVVLVILVVCLSALLVSYRNQVKDIVGKLGFMKDHDTNMTLREGLPFKELNALIDEINAIAEGARKEHRISAAEEKTLRETITHLSHDIRTPLTSLDGYVQMLKKAESTEERERYLEIIGERTGRLKELLDTLFTYAKLQDTEYAPAMEDVNMTGIVSSQLLAFHDDFRKEGRGASVSVTEEPVVVFGNAESIRRIIQNILKNALVHGVGDVTVTFNVSDGKACFKCSNGVIDPEEIDEAGLFSRFYSADDARSNASTGLGLYIARGLAEQMGGSVEAGVSGMEFEVMFCMPAGVDE